VEFGVPVGCTAFFSKVKFMWKKILTVNVTCVQPTAWTHDISSRIMCYVTQFFLFGYPGIMWDLSQETLVLQF